MVANMVGHLSAFLECNLDDWECFKSTFYGYISTSRRKEITNRFVFIVPVTGVYQVPNSPKSQEAVARGLYMACDQNFRTSEAPTLFVRVEAPFSEARLLEEQKKILSKRPDLKKNPLF